MNVSLVNLYTLVFKNKDKYQRVYDLLTNVNNEKVERILSIYVINHSQSYQHLLFCFSTTHLVGML